MSHFDLLKNGAEKMVGDLSSRRKRRLAQVRQATGRKTLDQFVIEKMEDRWLPAVSVTQTGSSLLITLDAANDNVLLQRTGGTGSDNINITASPGSISANSVVSNITSITVQDIGANSGQSLIFQSSSTGNFVSAISSDGIEVINISTRLNGTLSVVGSGSQVEGSVSNSFANQVTVTNSTLTLIAPQVSFPSVVSNNSTLNLAVAFVATDVTATDSTVSVANTIAPDFSGTNLVVYGGSVTVVKDSRLNSLTLNAGSNAPTAYLANATNLTTVTQNCGTLIDEGNVQNLILNNGSLTVRRSVGSVVGSVDNPKITTLFNVNGGTAVVQDDTVISGTTNINGTSTSVTIQAGANYSPTIGTTNVNNGTVSVSNTELSSNHTFTVYNGTVGLTNDNFLGCLSVSNGTVNITAGSYSSGVGIAGGSLRIDGATLRNNLNLSVPVLNVNGGTVSVRNSTIDASSNSNAVNVGALSSSLDLGNSTSPGNNTFDITAGGNPLFIRNLSLQSINALGNTWNYNGTNFNTTTQPFDIADYLFAAENGDYATSTQYGAVYFNGPNIYVLNNQQGYGVNSIWGAVTSAAPGDTVYAQGGANNYNETIDIRKTLSILGVANGTGQLPTLRPAGSVGTYGYFVRMFEVASNPQINVISNLSFDGSGLSASDANITRLIDQQFYANASSSLTLTGNISTPGFDPATNSEMIMVSGGRLVVQTTDTLNASIRYSTSGIDGYLGIDAGSTVNGPLYINPTADTIVGNIAGTLNGVPSIDLLLQCGTLNVTGTIAGSTVNVDGGVLNLTNGCITSLTEVHSGNFTMTGTSLLSGSFQSVGGTSIISGGTITADTASDPSNISATVKVTGGTLQMSGITINANESGATYRHGILVDGSQPGYVGSNISLSNLTVTVATTNNNQTAGIKTLGVDSVLYSACETQLSIGDGIIINSGNISLDLGGYNTNITNSVLGNIVLNTPNDDFIKLSSSILYNDQTGAYSELDASRVTYTGGSLSAFRPATVGVVAGSIPYYFEIQSRVIDYTTGALVGDVSLYPNALFVVNPRSIQLSVNASEPGDTIFVQPGTYEESLTIPANRTGLHVFGPTVYGNSTPAILQSPSGSNSAVLVQADNVWVLGFTLDGSNGTTNLLANGAVSGTSFGITNFNGTASTSIANLTVACNTLANFVNAGVYLVNNSGCMPSSIADNTLNSIGIDGFNGGIVLTGDAYASVTNNTMTGVTNGVVLRDFSTTLVSGSSDITKNTISSFATGITVSNMTGSASAFTIGGSLANLNNLTLATNVNTTLARPDATETIGIYLQGISSANVPTIADNTISGFAYGYDVTNVSPPLTISGGSVAGTTVAGVAVFKNQTFDPNGSAPGLGAANSSLTVSNVTVTTANNTSGFIVDANSVSGGASLTLDGGTSLTVGTGTGITAAKALDGASLTIKSATLDDTANNSATLGILNQGSTVAIQSGANISGFNLALSQTQSGSTIMSGGLVSGLFANGTGLDITSGNLSITGGTIETGGWSVQVNNPSSDVTIDSTSANTTISSTNSQALNIASANLVSVNQSAGNITSLSTGGAVLVGYGGTGKLAITGGQLATTNTTGTGVSFTSTGLLTISGGTISGNASGTGTGVNVTNGNANITGGTITTGFAAGVSFSSASGLLTVNNATSSPSITGSQTGINISAGSAVISSGTITGTNNSGIYISNGTAAISNAQITNSAVGINFNGTTANGSVTGVTFTGGTSDLQLNQTDYPTGSGVTIGANNSFSGNAAKFGYILNRTTQNYTLSGNTSFAGVQLSTLSVPANVSTLYAIQDKIVDGVDVSGYGTVVTKAGNLFVTPNSFLSPNTTTPSIQRAIDLSTTGGTLWIEGNSGSANYTGGFDTSASNITIQSGNETLPAVVNIEGNMVLSSTTNIAVRLGGATSGTYTQFNLVDANASPVNYANAVIQYSNISGFVPTPGEQFHVINLLSNTTSPGNSTLRANVVSTGMTVLQNEHRYELAPSQKFATLYGVDANRNDFVLVSVPEFVTNVVVYQSWTGSYFGDQVTYVDASGNTTLLTYGVDAASNVTQGVDQFEAGNATAILSVANGSYVQTLGTYTNGTVYSNNLSINVIGVNSTSVPDAQVYGNITVTGVSFNQNTTLNYRVQGANGTTSFDQINANGLVSLANAIGNITYNGNFSNPGLSTNSYLTLLDNVSGSNAPISGNFRNPNGTPLVTGEFFSVPANATNGFYSTYKLGTSSPYNDFALIWNVAPGQVSNVEVNATWATNNLDFGAMVTVNNSTYTIGIDAFGEMKSYQPVGGSVLNGGVIAVSPTGNVNIAAGSYNSTFTVVKGFSLTGPTSGDAMFPAVTGQTVLGVNGANGANITPAHWTGNLLFGDLMVGNGTIFENAASLIATDGTLNFQSGITFPNIELTASRSITISSNQSGVPVTLQTTSSGTGISASGSNVNVTLRDLQLTGTNAVVNLTNTGSVTFTNTTMSLTSNTPGTLNGPTALTLNYPVSTANNNLIVSGTGINFTPFGSANLSVTGIANLTLNANLGTTAGSAGNNTIRFLANASVAGGLIATGSGQDVFTISAPEPVSITSGAGNDTLTLATAGSYVASYDGGTGVNTYKTGPNTFNYIDIDGSNSGAVYLSRGNATTHSSFSNVNRLYGNAYTDIFSFTNATASIGMINGGNGNDQLNFSGTSGANTSFGYSNQLEVNINGSSAGSANYFNFSNATARIAVIDSFISVENLVGGTGDDMVHMLSGGTLAGTLSGGSGNNSLDYSTFPVGVRVDLSKGSATGIGGTGAYRVSNIRDIYGSSYNDMLTGDAGNNIIVGNDGNDSILGNAGNDILIGGIGSDTLRGGAGSNIDIGGYLNFDQGGTTSAYGIPGQYVDFVLRSMMNVWATSVDGTTFDTAAAQLESGAGVSVQVPGNTTTYNNIRLFAASSLSDLAKGTVFDDGQSDTLDLSNSTLNWIYIPTTGDVLVGGAPRRITYLYKIIP